VRAVAIDKDLIVLVSAVWQTTATAVRAGGEGFLIDSPVLPEELEALPSVLEQAGFPMSGLLCTHGDWDHLLARSAFPDSSLGAGEATCRRLADHSAVQQTELREFDDEFYIEGRAPLALEGIQSLPVPGRLSLGDGPALAEAFSPGVAIELELCPAPGHTADGTAFWIPWLEVLVCGDYLSPLEIPAISPDGSGLQYLETLERLAPLVAQAATVVPGHGAPMPRDRAQRVLEEDLAYLRGLLEHGASAQLPRGAGQPAQERAHAQNCRELQRER
jgi:glyoxylase-like metal-dependent hydrolase (beta-lactamase superfamily II)